MQSALEEWNAKVTKHRRWRLRINEKQEFGGGTKRQKKPKGSQAATTTTSMFCSLNGSEEAAAATAKGEDGNMMSSYGPGAHLPDEPVIRKNCKGQRNRRAKAQALQAKKEGRRDYKSLNWRAEKKDDEKKPSSRPNHNNATSAAAPPKKEEAPPFFPFAFQSYRLK
jgi:hypothetical protein